MPKGCTAFHETGLKRPLPAFHPGRWIRTAGIEASGDRDADTTARLDVALRKSNILELALQLTDPEWLMSYPLDDKTKFDVFRDCSRCHTLSRPSMSTMRTRRHG